MQPLSIQRQHGPPVSSCSRNLLRKVIRSMAMMQSKQVGGHSCPPSPLRNFYSYSGNKLNIQLCYPSKDFSFLLFSRSLHYNQGESPAMRHPCLEAQLSPPRSPCNPQFPASCSCLTSVGVGIKLRSEYADQQSDHLTGHQRPLGEI
jgi:hypothetical protein